jgi:hypothetical protein
MHHAGEDNITRHVRSSHCSRNQSLGWDKWSTENVFGRVFSGKLSAEYSAETNIRQGLPKRKKVLFSNFLFGARYFQESEDSSDFFCQCVLHCMFLLLRINLDHLQLLETCNCSQKINYFLFFPLIFAVFSFLCRIFVIVRIFDSIFLPNSRFRSKQKNPFSVDH